MLIAEYDYDVDIAAQREEALQEGLYQKAIETAKTMLAMGYPLGDICKIVGLSQEEVKAIN